MWSRSPDGLETYLLTSRLGQNPQRLCLGAIAYVSFRESDHFVSSIRFAQARAVHSEVRLILTSMTLYLSPGSWIFVHTAPFSSFVYLFCLIYYEAKLRHFNLFEDAYNHVL